MLYENTPVAPSSSRGTTCPLFTDGREPLTRFVMISRKTEAMAKRTNERLRGLPVPAIALPAIKVPPHRMAVRKSLR